MPKVSICVPVYEMKDGLKFLSRNLISIFLQKYESYEVIVSDDSEGHEIEEFVKKLPVTYIRNTGQKGMAGNTNNAMDHATGELIKILFQDDFFYKRNSLQTMVRHMTASYDWLAAACLHSYDGKVHFNYHAPYYSESENTLGSPSVTLFRRSITERFDPQFTYVLDLDLYKRLKKKYGKPKILTAPTVVIGLHDGQTSNLLSEDYKIQEHNQLTIKHENTRIAA